MMTDPAPRFGDVLRRQRRAAGLTQEELADRAGVSPRTIGDIERGIARSYRHETVHLLADALCLAPGERDAFEAAAFAEVATLPPIPVARPATMPSQATSFIGRDKALHEVTALLRRGPRLVTLVGPPGVGKTRLALAATATLSPGYPGAVVVTGLAPVAYAEGILPAIAASFGVSQADGTPLLTALIEHLRPRRAFLLLDNAEHVAVALAALVTDLLAGCPGLRVLTTSRSALNVPGEHTFVVAPLDLPPRGEVDPDAIARSPAVALFVERARAVVSSFTLSPAVARDVAAVCRRLDGLPLAIELAAAWANVVRPGDMASRLPSLLALPLGPEGASPGRQHSLWRAVAWSVDLLGPREQRLYRRLGVFAGGAGLSSVEAVCTDALADDDDDDENGRRSVRAALAALVDANLVRLEPDARAGDVQVGMMETIRAHAVDLLETSGEGEPVRQRHTAHYLAMVDAAEGGLRGQDQELWMARLGAEHDNLRAVLRRAVRGEEHRVAGLRIAGVLWRFWLMHGHLSEGRGWLDRLLARADVDTPPMIRADACNGSGVLAHSQGDYARAEAVLEEGLALRRQAGDTWGVAASLTNLGNVALDRGDYARATALHEDALALKRDLGDAWAISISLNNLGELAREQGEYLRAAAYHEESLEIKRQLGDAWGITASLHNLGQIALIQGDRERARALHTKVLAMAREMGDKRVIALSLYGVATTLTDDTATSDERMSLYHQSLELYREVGDRVAVVTCLEGLADVAIDQGDPQRATRLSATAATARAELGAPLAVDEQPMRERTLAAARSALGDDTFAAAWVKGQAMTMDEAAETSLGLA